jgi:hypothetical protein
LLQYEALGIPIYYSLENYRDNGLCHVYTIEAPWDLYPPRNLTYTLAYENSTDFLVAYVLNGTEYCCASTRTCVTEGLECDDGISQAQLTWANSATYYSNYQIYEEDQFPVNFFGPYCPFSSDSPTDDVFPPGDNNSDDDKYSSASVTGIALGCSSAAVVATFALTVLLLRMLSPRSRKALLGESTPDAPSLCDNKPHSAL